MSLQLASQFNRLSVRERLLSTLAAASVIVLLSSLVMPSMYSSAINGPTADVRGVAIQGAQKNASDELDVSTYFESTGLLNATQGADAMSELSALFGGALRSIEYTNSAVLLPDTVAAMVDDVFYAHHFRVELGLSQSQFSEIYEALNALAYWQVDKFSWSPGDDQGGSARLLLRLINRSATWMSQGEAG